MPRISYRTNIENLASLEKLAIQKGMTLNALITEALKDYTAKNGAGWISTKGGRPKKTKGG